MASALMITRHQDLACYGSEYKWVVLNLLRRGYELFAKAPVVKNLEKIQTLLSKPTPLATADHHAAFKLTDPTLDVFCIVTAFEYIAKGLLVKERMTIHRINKSLKELRQQQEKEPITVSEVLQHESNSSGSKFPDQGANEPKQIQALDDKTLTFGIIISKKSYWSSIGFDSDIVNLLSKLADRRNKDVHYFMVWFSEGGMVFPETISAYDQLKNYIETHVLELHNQLARDWGYSELQISRKESLSNKFCGRFKNIFEKRHNAR